MFIFPTLQDFQATLNDSASDTPPRVACVVFKRLLDGCSDLRALALFPITHRSLMKMRDPYLRLRLEGRKLSPSLGYANALRELSVSSAMFAVFAELNCPPLSPLEYLRIYATYLVLADYVPLSRNIFPSLRDLSILDLSNKSVLHKIWRELGSAAVQLMRVELHFRPRSWPGRTRIRRTYILSEVVAFLVAHSPRIVDLRLQVPPTSHYLSPISPLF